MGPKSTCCFAFILCTLLAVGQNRANFHHIIKQSRVQSGAIPLVYNDGTPHILYGPTPDPNFQICSDLEAIVTLGSGGIPNVDFFSITSNLPTSPFINGTTPLGTFTLDISRSTLGDPTIVHKIPFRARTWAVATVPFRYRFKTDSSFSTVSTNLSASLSYGYTWGISKITHRAMTNYSVTVGPFAGITSIDFKKSTVKNPSSWSADRTSFGYSYGVSITLARNNFGIVISAGADHALGRERKQWSYQNKPWIGLGINTGLGLF